MRPVSSASAEKMLRHGTRSKKKFREMYRPPKCQTQRRKARDEDAVYRKHPVNTNLHGAKCDVKCCLDRTGRAREMSHRLGVISVCEDVRTRSDSCDRSSWGCKGRQSTPGCRMGCRVAVVRGLLHDWK